MKKPNNISGLHLLIRILIYSLVVVFLLWNVCFGFIIGYILLVAFISAALLLRKKSIKQTLLMVSAVILLYLVTLPLTLIHFQIKSNKLYGKIQKGQQLHLNEKISIYGLNLTIGIAALPIYPEVARETLFMCIPAKDAMRTFNSDFFLKSKKIRTAIHSGKKRVVWSGNEFSFGHEESRYALALNPCTLTSLTTDNGTDYSATVDVRYAKKFEVILFSRPIKISIEEGLFWYLQEINWLHPYKANWVSSETK